MKKFWEEGFGRGRNYDQRADEKTSAEVQHGMFCGVSEGECGGWMR